MFSSENFCHEFLLLTEDLIARLAILKGRNSTNIVNFSEKNYEPKQE